MDRRHVRPLLAAVCTWACAFAPGCDRVHRQAVRKAPVSVLDDEAAKTDEETMRGLHDSGGSSGGWSRRARDIEKHFNVE